MMKDNSKQSNRGSSMEEVLAEIENDPSRKDLIQELCTILGPNSSRYSATERASLIGRVNTLLQRNGRSLPFDIEVTSLYHILIERRRHEIGILENAINNGGEDLQAMSLLTETFSHHPGYEKWCDDRLATGEGKNSKFFITLPKSGTIFISAWLAAQSGLKSHVISSGYFPAHNCSIEKVMQLASEPSIVGGHLDASPHNLDILAWLTDRVVVHIRDPRASLLSWIHHIDKIYRDRPWQIRFLQHSLKRDYFEKSLEEKALWLADSYFTWAISWIESWAQAE